MLRKRSSLAAACERRALVSDHDEEGAELFFLFLAAFVWTETYRAAIARCATPRVLLGASAVSNPELGESRFCSRNTPLFALT